MRLPLSLAQKCRGWGLGTGAALTLGGATNHVVDRSAADHAVALIEDGKLTRRHPPDRLLECHLRALAVVHRDRSGTLRCTIANLDPGSERLVGRHACKGEPRTVSTHTLRVVVVH